MTAHGFLPRLFVFQIVMLMFAIVAFVIKEWWMGGGILILILAFTLPVNSALSEDPRIKENGEILTVLAGYDQMLVEVSYKLRAGKATEEDREHVLRQRAEFEETIELHPTDNRCIYRWKK